MVLYTNDTILAGPGEQELDQIIKDMKMIYGLDLTAEGGTSSDFLRVDISRKPDGTIRILLIITAFLPSKLRWQLVSYCVIVQLPISHWEG